MAKCDRPPEGWRCTREKDHDGPCAAVEDVCESLALALDAIDGVKRIIDHARTGRRYGVTEREAMLYDKGYDDALDHIRTTLRLALPGEQKR